MFWVHIVHTCFLSIWTLRSGSRQQGSNPGTRNSYPKSSTYSIMKTPTSLNLTARGPTRPVIDFCNRHIYDKHRHPTLPSRGSSAGAFSFPRSQPVWSMLMTSRNTKHKAQRDQGASSRSQKSQHLPQIEILAIAA